MADPDMVKLSDAAQACGIPADILKLMAGDGLLPQAVRRPRRAHLLPRG